LKNVSEQKIKLTHNISNNPHTPLRKLSMDPALKILLILRLH